MVSKQATRSRYDASNGTRTLFFTACLLAIGTSTRALCPPQGTIVPIGNAFTEYYMGGGCSSDDLGAPVPGAEFRVVRINANNIRTNGPAVTINAYPVTNGENSRGRILAGLINAQYPTGFRVGFVAEADECACQLINAPNPASFFDVYWSLAEWSAGIDYELEWRQPPGAGAWNRLGIVGVPWVAGTAGAPPPVCAPCGLVLAADNTASAANIFAGVGPRGTIAPVPATTDRGLVALFFGVACLGGARILRARRAAVS